MNSNDRNDQPRPPDGGARGPNAIDPAAAVTTVTYEAKRPLAAGWPAPKRAPISCEEMDSLTRLLQNFRTRLLWLHFEWAEAPRKGRLARGEVVAQRRCAI